MIAQHTSACAAQPLHSILLGMPYAHGHPANDARTPNSPGAQADACHVLHLLPVDAAPLVLQLQPKDAGVMRIMHPLPGGVLSDLPFTCVTLSSQRPPKSELMVDTNDVLRGMEYRAHNASSVDAVGVPGPPHPAGHSCMPEVVRHQILRQILHGLQTWKAKSGQTLGFTASTYTCQ